MNPIHNSVPVRQPQARPSLQRQSEEENPFDLTVLNHSREMYFLPGIDRLAAHAASQSQTPVQVRVEANGQFLEYTLDGQHPEKTVQGSLNGLAFEMTSQPTEDGKFAIAANTSAGSWSGQVHDIEGGTQVNVDLADMPIGQRIVMDPHPQGDLIGEVIGNFACARVYEGIYKNDDGSWHLLGELGAYNLDAQVTFAANGGLTVEGDLGNIHYRETVTPQPAP